jgi:squalene synthase HpnC
MTTSETTMSDIADDARPVFAVGAVMDKATAENFTVASRLLPRRYREDLLALYGYARFIDDIGDLASGDRSAQLDWSEGEIRRALEHNASHPVFIRAGATARALGIGEAPFVDLIQANRQDQVVTRYPTFEDLEAYCGLSANPVGRMVLSVFGAYRDETVELSDRICVALQLVEHWQDVAEDMAAGRIYLPLEDLNAFGVDEHELAASAATPAFRRLMAFEVMRARALLESGRPLIAMLSPVGRVAIAGFIGGGLANLDAIEAGSFDVLASPRKAKKTSVALRSLSLALARNQLAP